MKNNILIPADVPQEIEKEFVYNYESITKKTGNLMLFAGDQKIEHLNNDFFGNNIPVEVNNPTHLFTIASQGNIGAFATQLGLITRYGKQFPKINYVVKLNAKTNLATTEQQDPFSELLWTVEDVINLKIHTGLPIRGIGFTIYLGSQYESSMLAQAAQVVHRAHQYGLVTILWMYPRGKSVKKEKDTNLIAGAAGIANCLGADFAKINTPEAKTSEIRAELLQQAVAAAGNTKIICSGGPSVDPKDFLQDLYNQLHIAGTAGNATGRNIYQQPQNQAIKMTQAIASLVFEGKDVKEALNIISS